MLMALGQGLLYVSTAEARLFFSTEEDGVQTPAFYINQGDTSDDFVDLNFGTTAGAQLRYDVVNDEFLLNRDLDLGANELQDFKIERLAVAPTCDGAAEGRMYFNTASSQTFVCDGTVFNVLENEALATVASSGDYNDLLNLPTLGTAADNAETDFATSAQGLLADSALQSGDNVSELVNDAGFITTDSDTTYDAGTGLTLTGTTFSNDLGETIETGEITDGTITAADLNLTDITLNDLTNDAGFLTTVDISDDTNLAAGTGATLTGDSISVDLGTSIDSSEIDLNTIVADDINTDAVGADELADDAVDTAAIQDNAVTTDQIGTAGVGDANRVLTTDASGNPQWEDKSNFATSTLTTNNLFVGVGGVATDTAVTGDLTMTGGNFQIAANAVDSAEIADDAVSDTEIDFANVTLADFTNDAGFVTTDNDTTYTASGGVVLTGTNFTATLGTDIVSGEIVDGTIAAADLGTNSVTSVKIQDGAVALADLATGSVNSTKILNGSIAAIDMGTSSVTGGTGGIIQDGTVSAADLGTNSVAADEIATNAVNDAEINYTNVTLNDFTNDAGFLTTVDISDDTNLAAGTGATLTGDSISVDLGTDIVTGEIVDGTITAADLNLTDIDLADFTNTPGFITTDTDTTYTGSGGVTLTGTNFTADLGTSVGISEIENGGNNQVLTTTGAGVPQWEDKTVFATAAQGTLADSALQSGDNISELVNDSGFITTDTNTTYTGSGGVTLTGTDFTADLGTSIDASEIDTNAVADDEIDYTAVTLNDFTNDAGFLTTVDISDDTNLAAGTGATLTGDSISVDLGTSIDASEIDTNAVNDDEINYTNVTLADFTNDAGFVTTDNDTTYTGSGGVTLTGTNFTADLGTDIDDTELDFGSITLADFTNDAGFITTDTNTTYTGSGGVTLTGTNFTADLGTSIDASEIDTNAVNDDEINYTNVTLADFTNDAGFVTTDNDTTYTGSGGVTLTGTNFTADLGTDIDDTELDFGSITLADFTNDAGFITTDTNTTYTGSGGVTLTGTNFTADLGTSVGISEIENGGNNQVLTTTGAGVPQWEDKTVFATAAQGTLADSALQSGDNISELVNDSGFVTTDNDTTYTGSGGVTLTGTDFTADLGTDIDDTELDFGSITLADFTNDAGFVTTDNDTTYTGGTGITIAGTTINNDLGTSIDASEIDTDAVNDDEINYTNVTLADFTNDAGFVTTDNNTTYTGSGGVTLTGTNFTADLGTSIETGEIGDNEVTLSKIADGGPNQVLTTDGSNNPQWEDKTVFATSAQGSLADSALQSGDNISELVNDSGFITTDTNTTYTGSGGVTLTGTNFTADLGTSIDASEIDTNAVNDDEINYTNVTLNDFTNDAGFLTTVDISDDTNLAAGTGATLTGDSISVDLGTDIVTGEIVDGTITAADLNLTDIDLADFTNTPGFITTDTDTTYTGSGGVTLTGTNFTADLGTDIDDTELDFGSITLADFTNDAGFITTDTNTTYTGSGGVTLTGTNFTADLGTSIDATEIDTDAVADDEIDYTAVTLLDFTNDANFLTTVDVSDDTNLTAGSGATLTGDEISVDLGTSIDASEIDTNAVADDEIDYTAVTLLDFTNDANFLTTVDVSDDTNLTAGTGATLTGDEISVDLGTSIDTAEIELNTIVADDINTDAVGADELADDAVDTAAIQNNAVDGSKLALGSDTEGDIMFYNGTDWDRLPVGTANQVLQVNGAADAPEWAASTATKYQFLDIFGCVRGSASAGTVAGGNSAVVRFDGGNNSQMRCALPVPSDWQAGTDINIEVYYSPSDTSAGDVSFVLRHAAFGIGETVTNGSFTDTLTGPETITASTELDIYELTGDIPAATLAVDDMINFNLRRQPGDAADTYAGDINIHQLRISYTGKELQ